MKIALDTQLALGTATGIGEYVRGLANSLRECGAQLTELCEPCLDPWRFDRRVLWDQVLLPYRARACGADVLHCASGTIPLVCTLPVVATVHDVAWLHVQEHARPYARHYFGSYSIARYRRARRLVVDSEFSRRELLQVTGIDPSRVEVCYPGVAGDFIALRRGDGDGRTILAVGTVEPRKNLALLVRTLAALPHAHVVAVGPATPYARTCLELARELGVEGRLELRGYVERDELLALYARCAVVAVPSRYEGFGYAAAQALCAGVPVLCARGSALDEVAGEDAPLLGADDTQAWTSALRDALLGAYDASARAARTRASARLSWGTTAQRMLAIYESALAEEGV